VDDEPLGEAGGVHARHAVVAERARRGERDDERRAHGRASVVGREPGDLRRREDEGTKR